MKRALAIADHAADLTFSLVLGLNLFFLLSFLVVASLAAFGH